MQKTEAQAQEQKSPPALAWHATEIDEAMRAVGAGSHGLDSREARSRLERHGRNILPEARRSSLLIRLLRQFNNLLIYVLLAAAVTTVALGHFADAAVILAVVLINAGIGFVQEGRAEQALDAIRAMITPHATVLRDGQRLKIDAAEIVPGDLVVLEAGDRVPADLRLLKVRNLRIDEAVLTGESLTVEKAPRSVAKDVPLGDRVGMAYSGTMVVAGQGQGIAVATGERTEIGRISRLISRVETLETPLLRQMSVFARHLTIVILTVSAAVFAFAVWVQDYTWPEAFMAMVGLAVAAIPEGLPAVMTITLAIGVSRMAARNAIIRRLPAVETLGAVSVICSDKTGTLTRNEMMVSTVATSLGLIDVTGTGYEPRGGFLQEGRNLDPETHPVLPEIARAALLCNDAQLRHEGSQWLSDGDPMEGALVSFAMKAGVDPDLTRRQIRRRDEIPFDAQHRYMATLHHFHDDGARIYIKGAPETILDKCKSERGQETETTLDKSAWLRRIDEMAGRGQRVLALAMKVAPAHKQDLASSDVRSGLTLLGLVGLIDPPRDEVIAAVRECRTAGIKIKMITGDHVQTAKAIAEQIGLENTTEAATGQDLEALNDARLSALAERTAVFARTSPEHKLRLVTALQSRGAIVAMTGDGVNDAPALKRADIGVAMGQKGTEAAKEAAQMVLGDDNFASIVAAVREGRTVYDNLKKVIAWTLPTNGGEALAIVGAILFGFTLPVTPLQILWINMVTAVALGLTLAFEPTEDRAMQRPPRGAADPLLSRYLLWRIGFVSFLFVLGAFGMFFWALERGLSLELARTLVVNTIVVMEIFYLFSVRYVHSSSLTWRGVLGTNAVLIGLLIVVVAQLALTYAPVLQGIFETRPVSLLDGLAIVTIGVVLLLIMEIEKQICRRLFPRRPRSVENAA